MGNKKVILAGLVMIFLIFSFLAIVITINGKNLSCDKCIVHFTTTRKLGEELGTPLTIDFKINDIYLDLKENGHCMVKFSKTEGFYENKPIN